MTKCPHCAAELTATDLSAGRCPHCLRDVSNAQTVDDSSTIRADVPPPPGSLTVVDRPIAHTLDADASSDAPAPSSAATPGLEHPTSSKEDSSGKATPDSGTVQDCPILLPIDGDAEAAPRGTAGAATVDGIDAVDPSDGAPSAARDHAPGDTHSAVLKTVDSIDLPPAGATLDSTDVPPPPGRSGTVADVNMRTVDSQASQGETPEGRPRVQPGEGTLEMRSPMSTLDATQMPDVAAAAAVVAAAGQTVALGRMDKTIAGSVGAAEPGNAAQTKIDSRAGQAGVPPPAGHSTPPRSAKNESTLVIQTRAFSKGRSTATAGAGAGAGADYDVLKQLGEGGMGVVFAARQASIDRTVAVKMLKANMASDDNQRNKFMSEAVITGELEHPNIVPIYDLGQNDSEALFYSMKCVQGTPWDDVIGRKSLTENLEILLRVCDAVAFAHAHGVVHRDLKPENTMLGGYGEVLVMDWGLALPFGEQKKARAVGVKAGMGGTPAYMSPEMATGPFDELGPACDIYLLGAILYEIVTGRPPHEGRDVMKCLFAAAKNEIVPTDKTGELVDIALRAMATKPKDRYESVPQLQHAIRTYQEHSESIATATRAEEELQRARESSDYESYSKAVFGFQEALSRWDGNDRARAGASATKLAYAACALERDDLDLAASLLDHDNPEHTATIADIDAAIRERAAKKRRLKNARVAVIGLAAAVFVTVCSALIVTNRLRSKAEASAAAESIARQEAEDSARSEAIAKQKALDSAKAEAAANKIAQQKRHEALDAKADAERAARAELAARQEAEYEEYVALIGLAAANIEENAFDNARSVLNRCQPELRNWEWRRLMYLCTRSVENFNAHARISDVAFAPDGQHFVTADAGGAKVWDLHRSQQAPVPLGANEFVDAVAWSPTRDLVAIGGRGEGRYLRLWNPHTGEPVMTIEGHEGPVASVTFSANGKRLLTTSMDNTARLWDVEFGRELGRFREHGWLVWDAAFSADETFVVTASHDGTSRIWPIVDLAPDPAPGETGTRPVAATSSAAQPAYFDVHEGPVYSVAVSPTEDLVVTGGYDKQLLLWRPGDLQPFDFDGLLAGRTPPPPPYEKLGEHAAAVRCVAFSRDGRLLLSAGHDNTVKLWDVAARRLLKSFRGHDSWVRACAFSPDGDWVLSAGFDEHARLWNVEGYEEVRVLQGRVFTGHADAVLSAAFSRDDGRIVTASRDRTARMYDASNGRALTAFVDGHSFLATTAAFFDGGRRLLTAAADDSVRVWNNDGVELVKLEGTGLAAAAAVSHDGTRIATGSSRIAPDDPSALTTDVSRQRALLWDATTGDVLRELTGHNGEVTALAFSPGDRWLFTGDTAGRGLLWDLRSGDPPHRLSWHTSKITAAAFLHDGSRLLTASDDRTVCQWDTRVLPDGPDAPDEPAAEQPDLTLKIEPLAQHALKHPQTVWSLDVARDGQFALTSCADGVARLWNLADASVVQSFKPEDGAASYASLAPDGRIALAVDAERRKVHRWDLQSGLEIQSPGRDGTLGPCLDLQQLGGLVWSAIFTPDSQDIVTIGGDEARRWNLAEQTEVMSFSPHAAVAAAAFSPTGDRIVTAGWDHSAKVWDAVNGTPLQKLTGHSGQVNSAVFSPRDGTIVLTASDDGTARLWRVAAGELLRQPLAHPAAVRDAAFSDDAQRIATACDDGVVRIWNAADAAVPAIELRGHTAAVLSVRFSGDGARVVSGSDDNSARIWDARNGALLHELKTHTAPVTSVAFSPDGSRLLTASEDFTARLWDADRGREILNLKGHTQAVTSVCFSSLGRNALTGSRDGTAVLWLAVDQN